MQVASFLGAWDAGCVVRGGDGYPEPSSIVWAVGGSPACIVRRLAYGWRSKMLDASIVAPVSVPNALYVVQVGWLVFWKHSGVGEGLRC